MNKQQFLAELERGLCGLPQEDIEERLGFYSEMIDDRMEEGLSEEEAVAGVGSVEEIVSQIVAEIPLSKLVKEKMLPKEIDAWVIVLVVLGFPIWLPLLIASAAIIFSMYVVLWALIVSLWAVFVAVVACAPACVILCIVLVCTGEGVAGLALLGAGLACAGVAILLYIGCIEATKGGGVLAKKMLIAIKKIFVKKEGNHA